MEEIIVCAEQYVFISISLLFRKGNVCTSKAFFEEQSSGAGTARLGVTGLSGMLRLWAAAD
jgi:hypothetical protein